MSNKKYAIVYLLFGKDLYIIGACINAYVNRILTKNRKEFDLIVMVDKNLMIYQDILHKFFDRVEEIDMFEVNLSKDFADNLNKRYTTGTSKLYANKWHCLKFTEYDKILFLDIDLLPVSEKFYSIFDFPTPALDLNITSNVAKPITGNIVKHEDFLPKNITIDKKLIPKKLNYVINGGIVLISPKEGDFAKYMSYIKSDFQDQEVYAPYGKFPDETSLTLFYTSIKKQDINVIPLNYTTLSWFSDKTKLAHDAYAYNFLYEIKPWVIPLAMCFDEEIIWLWLAKKVYKKDKILKKIYGVSLVRTIVKYIESKKTDDFPFNKRCDKNPKIKDLCDKGFELANDKEIIKLVKSNLTKNDYENMDKNIWRKIRKIVNIFNNLEMKQWKNYGLLNEKVMDHFLNVMNIKYRLH